MNDYLVKIVATYEIEVEVADAASIDEARDQALLEAQDLELYNVCVGGDTTVGFDNYEVAAVSNLDEN